MDFFRLIAALITLAILTAFATPSFAACEFVTIRVDDGRTTTDQPPVDKWGDAISPRDSLSPNTGGTVIAFEGFLETDYNKKDVGQACTP